MANLCPGDPMPYTNKNEDFREMHRDLLKAEVVQGHAEFCSLFTPDISCNKITETP